MQPVRLLVPLLALLMLDVSVSAQTAYLKPPQVVADVLASMMRAPVSTSSFQAAESSPLRRYVSESTSVQA